MKAFLESEAAQIVISGYLSVSDCVEFSRCIRASNGDLKSSVLKNIEKSAQILETAESVLRACFKHLMIETFPHTLLFEVSSWLESEIKMESRELRRAVHLIKKQMKHTFVSPLLFLFLKRKILMIRSSGTEHQLVLNSLKRKRMVTWCEALYRPYIIEAVINNILIPFNIEGNYLSKSTLERLEPHLIQAARDGILPCPISGNAHGCWKTGVGDDDDTYLGCHVLQSLTPSVIAAAELGILPCPIVGDTYGNYSVGHNGDYIGVHLLSLLNPVMLEQIRSGRLILQIRGDARSNLKVGQDNEHFERMDILTFRKLVTDKFPLEHFNECQLY